MTKIDVDDPDRLIRDRVESRKYFKELDTSRRHLLMANLRVMCKGVNFPNKIFSLADLSTIDGRQLKEFAAELINVQDICGNVTWECDHTTDELRNLFLCFEWDVDKALDYLDRLGVNCICELLFNLEE